MDKFLLKVCSKDTKRKSLRHSLSIFINLEHVPVQPAGNDNYVTPFLKTVSILESSCLLRDGFNFAMKNVSKFLHVLPSFGASSKIIHKKECSLLLARCLAGSDLLSAELCSDQRSSTLRMVSQMQVSPQLHIPLKIFHDGCKLRSFNGKSDFTFFVNHFTAISYFSPVN